jgi:hypothetical protein
MTGSGVIRRLSAADATRPEKRSGSSASREVARIVRRNASDCRQIDVVEALSQIGCEEKAAAADKVSPIVRHRASTAQLKAMGFAALNPSYRLRLCTPYAC